MHENFKCRICGFEKKSDLFELKDYRYRTTDNIFTLVKCEKCGFISLSPFPAKNELYVFFNVEEYYNTDLDFKEEYKKSIKKNKACFSFIEKLRCSTLLDAGCRNGHFLKYAKDNGVPEVNGVEISDIAKIYKDIPIYIGELTGYNCNNNYFDCVTMWNSLQCVYDLKEYIEKIYKILKPGGKFVFQVPNFNSIRVRYMKIEDVPRHINFFTPEFIRKFLKEKGFKKVNISYKNKICDGSIKEFLVFLYKKIFKRKSMDEILSDYQFYKSDKKKPLDLKIVTAIDRLITVPLSWVSVIFKFNGVMTVTAEK